MRKLFPLLGILPYICMQKYEFDGGISITVLSLDDTHYGNKK